MSGLLATAVLSSLAGLAGSENRAWWLELEVRGPLEEVVLDAGADGETHVLGPWRGGEIQRLAVPVPVRSPLGSEGLSSVPLPEARAHSERDDAAEAGAVRVVGWTDGQPDASFARLSPGLRARPRPPAARPEAAARSFSGAAALLLAAGGVLLAALLGRRRLLALAAGLGAGLAAGGLVLAGVAPPRTLAVLEGEAGAPRWVRVTAGRGGLEGPLDRLEVRPGGRRLRLEVDARAPERVRAVASGALVHALRLVAPPGSSGGGGGNPWGELAEAWIRTPGGNWSGHGAWPAGAGLPPPLAEAPAPPGWLSAGLPPGTGVLLGRFAGGGGGWLRLSGFDPSGFGPGFESERD